MDFVEFPKIARLSRDIVITEKLDGTNAQVVIKSAETIKSEGILVSPIQVHNACAACFGGDFYLWAGSRNHFITTQADNCGFAKWVVDNCEELVRTLGEGQHFGEWWGRGIQRNYSQTERHFSLFNTHRWGYHFDDQGHVGPCRVVPTLYFGPMEDHGVMKGVQQALRQLETYGSAAAPGFMAAEGIVIYHKASNQLFKKTLLKDEAPKGKE
jgi:hypothetical protein